MEEMLFLALMKAVLSSLVMREFSELNQVIEDLARYRITGRVVLKIPQ